MTAIVKAKQNKTVDRLPLPENYQHFHIAGKHRNIKYHKKKTKFSVLLYESIPTPSVLIHTNLRVSPTEYGKTYTIVIVF